MDCHDSFGEWLRQRRRAFDLTQADLAQRVGCSVSGLRKIEADERRPSRQMAELLARQLQIPLDKCPMFVKVARGVELVERLGAPEPMPVAAWFRPDTPRPASSLPTLPTPTIGREHELAALARLLRDPECRLVTLVGVGGIGKTRLAIAAAAAQQEAFADGVFFAPLAATHSVEHIAPTIARAVGLHFSGQLDPQAQLVNYLRSKRILLLLDNLEHLVDGIERLAEMLASLPELKLLVTSRERLNLRGEWVFEVQGLPVPADDAVEDLENYSSVVLFLQTARQSWSSFELTAEERPHLIRICRLVDGLPLAVELAAGWVRLLSCSEIAQEIERGLGVFSTSARDVPERHRSMRAVFDHSWALLAEKERQVLRRLSVFRGGFRREAAESVAGADLPVLATLTAKSLLCRTSMGRYNLHELVRQYAADHLHQDPDETSDTRDRHSVYYTDYVGQLEGSLKGPQQLEALADMDVEIDNIQSAWRWAVTRGKTRATRRAIRALWCFYEIRGWFQEAKGTFGWAAETLAQTVGAKDKTDAASRVLCEYMRAHQGWFCFKHGEVEESQRLLSTSLAVLRSGGATADVMDALYFAGVVEWFTGDYARARARFLEELALATQIGDRWCIALAHGNLGLVALTIGEYGEAQEQWQTALASVRALGDQRLVAAALQFFGRLKCTLGAHDEARAYLRESLALSAAVGDRWIHALALGQLGQVAYVSGEYDEAVRMFRDSLGLVREISEGWSTLQALKGLGVATLAMEQYDESRSAFCEAFTLAREMRAWPEALDALAGLANWSAQQGELEAALAQTVLVQSHPATKQETGTQAAQLRTKLEAQLTQQQINAVEARMQAESFDTVVTEFLRSATSVPQR